MFCVITIVLFNYKFTFLSISICVFIIIFVFYWNKFEVNLYDTYFTNKQRFYKKIKVCYKDIELVPLIFKFLLDETIFPLCSKVCSRAIKRGT